VQTFIDRHADKLLGVLNGFDRLVFRGTLRTLAYVEGMRGFLWRQQILLKNFKEYSVGVTRLLGESSRRAAVEQGRPVLYLSSAKTSKEDMARGIAKKDGIKDGLVCLLESVEPCMTYEIHRNREEKRLELRRTTGKCKFIYHYLIHPTFGFMNARIQTWFPFNVQVCLNGREWLARSMDKAGLAYERRDNCFAWLQDVEKAQALMDRQLEIEWPRELARIARVLNPAHGQVFRRERLDYYWSVFQSEWATDLMFRDARSLRELYRPLVRHAIDTYSSADVMRFLGRPVHGGFKGEVVSDFKDRAEGVRVKHRAGENSVKIYDKQGSVLRVETTVNDPTEFKVFRAKEGDEGGEREWRPMRKGIADLHRRSEISQKSNERYLEALAAVDSTTSLGELLSTVARPTTWNGARVRGLRPWAPDDLELIKAVSRGEFCVNGFRNRDLQGLLFTSKATSPEERRRRSGRISRLLRLLRAHGLIHKLPRSHRYKLSPRGRQVATALLAAHDLSLAKINTPAA